MRGVNLISRLKSLVFGSSDVDRDGTEGLASLGSNLRHFLYVVLLLFSLKTVIQKRSILRPRTGIW